MADNYIEKKMADYRAGRLVKSPRRVVGSRQKQLAVHLNNLPELVEPLRKLGVAVSFSLIGPAINGNHLAQQSGALFVPQPLTKALLTVEQRRGRQPDAVVSSEPADNVTILISDSSHLPVHLISPALSVESQAQLIVALSKILKPVAVTPRG